ncbi:Pseudouridine-5'-phosphate glycosidase [Smittium mucronatum]|uniref:Pseudouridine-5'-phosphate glycosidase n=1 Tax=Smittium mucronatum TaxID=133383 RepID=A0A1R0H1X1_9FUNG|nr:Pseudouridine-5'-phosphate glycosidase [Smittium mucronatum]
MPYPSNFETAKAVESIVSQGGAVPATIALLDGKINIGKPKYINTLLQKVRIYLSFPHNNFIKSQSISPLPTLNSGKKKFFFNKTGLTVDQIERLSVEGKKVIKTSIRDMAMVLSKKELGATTVSSTVFSANLAGIKVFVTGGIGGVHRDFGNIMDVSSDLTELGRTPVSVICAGAKSILDLPKTLEYLETLGTPVVTIGDTREFPAFFSRTSGLKVWIFFTAKYF